MDYRVDLGRRVKQFCSERLCFQGFLVFTAYFLTVWFTAGISNRLVYGILKLNLPGVLAPGNLYDNMWIGGLVEPFSTKLGPLLFIAVFGPYNGVRLLIGLVLGYAVIFKVGGVAGYPVSANTQLAIMVFTVIGATLGWYLFKTKELDYPEIATQKSWIFGAVIGFIVGISEFLWYVVEIGVPVCSRIPAVSLHTVTGLLVVGAWVRFKDDSHPFRWLMRLLAVALAIALHALVWNSWIVDQEWYLSAFC